jgi:hypothetical protein
MNNSWLFYLAVIATPVLLLVNAILQILLAARIRSMHQEMIDTHETLKHKQP